MEDPECTQEVLSEHKDARSNPKCLTYGINHSLLPEKYCDLVVSPDEATCIRSMQEDRQDSAKTKQPNNEN